MSNSLSTMDELVSKMDSKYTLVIAVAKRARELLDGAPRLVDTKARKPVTQALDELMQGKLELYYPDQFGVK